MVEGPIKRRRFKRRTVRNVLLILAVVLVLVSIALLGTRFYQQQAARLQEEDLLAIQGETNSLAGFLGDRLGAYGRTLDDVAGQDTLLALFESDDPAALHAKAEELVGEFPLAMKLRLLKPGVNEVDNATSPPLSYASLDLLRRAEASQAPSAAEVHLFGTPSQHIVVVRRVTNREGMLVGLLHLSLDVRVIDETMAKLALPRGYAELHQAVHHGAPLVLARRGSGAARTKGDPITSAVVGTEWTLAYWPWAARAAPGASGSGEYAFGGLAGGIGAGAVILGVVGAWLLLRRGRRTKVPTGEAAVYAGAVHGILLGAHPGLERLVPGLPKVARGEVMPPVPGAATGAPATEPREATRAAPVAEDTAPPLPSNIFRAYDIRGIVGKTLTADSVQAIGQAIGSEAHDRGQHTLVVGRDGRTSSPELTEALIKGLRASGGNVIDIGMVPTPLVYFATHFLHTGSGVMVTGSHNPPNYNGLKIMLAGETLSGDAVAALRDRITARRLVSGNGDLSSKDITADYIRRVNEDIPVALDRDFKLVVDCGNGVAGALAPAVLRALGHEVVELFCEVDGSFPNHQPDPSQPENLKVLIDTVKQEKAHLGFAFDGDGDRLGVVDSAGNIIFPDRQMMLFAGDVLSRVPGAAIIFDVKCSRHLARVIEQHGGKPVMWKTGHSVIKQKMREENAPLAGELSGHFFFKDRWFGFDDAMYAAGRMLEILAKSRESPKKVFAKLPGGIATPELRLSMPERSHASFMKDFRNRAVFDGTTVTEIDGLRVDFADGWGLIRPSNTTPHLILRFEGDNVKALTRIQDEFRRVLQGLDPKLKLPF